MAEDLNNRLSGEDIRRFEQTLKKFDDSLARQEEITKRALENEKIIAERRITYLHQYFDEYEKLDMVAKKASSLNEAFLILESLIAKSDKLAENILAARNAAERTNYEVSRAESESAATSDSQNKPKNNNSNNSQNNQTQDAPPPPPPPNQPPKGGEATGGGGQNPPPTGDLVEQTLSDEALQNFLKQTQDDVESAVDKYGAFLTRNSEERLNEIAFYEDATERKHREKALQERYDKERIDKLNSQAEKVKSIEEAMMDLTNKRLHSEEEAESKIADLRLSQQQSMLGAANEAAEASNALKASIDYFTNPEYMVEAGKQSQQEKQSKDEVREAKAMNDAIAKDKAKLELYYTRKNKGVYDEEVAKKVAKDLAKKYKEEEKNEKNLSKQRERLAKIENEKKSADEREELRKGVGALSSKDASFEERKQALYELTHDAKGNADVGKALSAAMVAVSDLVKQLDDKIDKIAEKKGEIDTRLQGSNNEKFMGSYWDQLTRDMTAVGAVNPFFKQDDFANNIKSLVDEGIAFDLKQRAFLMTIQSKIANTFEVADGTLLRLIRLQQEDSTAGRLGMESALNAFLNEMYENTEYLKQVADGVRNSLAEMEALMGGAEATEVEFQVQKWLGSLYSVGMSQEAVNSISSALGQIAAGQVEGLVNGGAGNLLVMAANDAGLSIADILTDGINSSDMNKLLQAAVNYLAEMADSSKDSQVVQQQLASVFGVKASDLKAATNLVSQDSTSIIYGNSMTYSDMMAQLYSMASSMGARTSISEMMTNIWENGQYTLAGSMASNPISYLTYKLAGLLDDTVGGIDLPFVNVMGFGVDLNTTVSDLMRVAAVGAGILGNLGPMISGLGSSFSGQAMLNKLGFESDSRLAVTPRGSGGVSALGSSSNSSVSGSGYVGNASGSDVKDSTIQESEDSKKQQMIEAKEEEEANQVDVLNTTVVKIYELLDSVANGNKALRVKVDNYGLIKSSSNGNLGGVGALGLDNSTGDSSSGGSMTGGITSGGNSNNNNISSGGSAGRNGGINGSIDMGGWVMV